MDPTYRVPPVYRGPGQNGAQGGLTVYYTQYDLSRDDNKQQPIKAFHQYAVPKMPYC